MAAQAVIDRAIEAWQPLYSTPLSQADGEEIVENVTAYLSLISEWVSARKAQGG